MEVGSAGDRVRARAVARRGGSAVAASVGAGVRLHTPHAERTGFRRYAEPMPG
ncbi:hypothetical protein HEK131_38160 [Streptomyces seoulensis]|nr:hypothetical protein HEK131_38160 [Streptomyces seoulensis]